MKLDFKDVKELENKQAAEGNSDFTITAAKETTSKNGTHMLVIDAKDSEGGFVRDNVCLEGPGAFKAKQFFKSIGVMEDEVAGIEAVDLIGYGFTADIIHEEYEGKLFSKVKKYI